MKLLVNLSPDGAASGGVASAAPDPGAQGGGGEGQGGQGQDQGQTGEELFNGEGQTAGGGDGEGTGSGQPGGASAASPNAPAAAPGITKEDVQSILEQVIPAATRAAQQSHGQQQQQQAAPQMTQEEFDRTFNVFRPSNDLIQRLRAEDPQVAMNAVLELRDGLIRQAMTMAEYRVQQHLNGMKQQFSSSLEPIQSYVTEQQARSFRDDFFKDHPDLEPYETIVDAVASKLAGTGFSGSRKEVMDRYAKDAKAVVQQLLANANAANGQAAAGGNGNNNGAGGRSPATTGKNRMSTLSGGGQGGTSRPTTNAAGQKGPAGIEVFD